MLTAGGLEVFLHYAKSSSTLRNEKTSPTHHQEVQRVGSATGTAAHIQIAYSMVNTSSPYTCDKGCTYEHLHCITAAGPLFSSDGTKATSLS